MKKLFLLTFLMLGLYGITEAQVCKISGAGDNVEVFSARIENGNTVVVTVGNDSQNISANVTVTVEVTYKYSNGNSPVKLTKEGKVIAKPNQESVITIRIPEQDKNGRIPTSVKVTNISGTKCQ